MNAPLERILAALREHGHEPRKAGAEWACRCPAHDDRKPSLSIREADDGRVLVNCHAGCTAEAVCAAVGLTLGDLFTDGPPRRSGSRPNSRQRVTKTPRNPARNAGFGDGDTNTFPMAHNAVAELERRHGPRSAIWTYLSAAGKPVGLVIRWNTPDGKDVRPVSLKADGSGWIIGGMPTPRPLYGLPDLLATKPGDRVYVTEGEKAADAARAVGLLATTSPHGSKSADKADWSPMAGRDVVILPDHDEAGERYADDVARLATAAGAKSVRVVRLVALWAGMPKGGDMADLVEHRGGDVDPIRADVEALASRTDPKAVVSDESSPPLLDLDAVFPHGAEYARKYLWAVSRSSQTPIEMPALLALAIASAALCNVARVRGHGDHVEPAQLWGLVLCEPAVRKSAVLSELLAPIVAWEKAQAQDLAPLIAEALQRRKIDEKRLKAIEDHAARQADKQKAAGLTEEAVQLAQSLDAAPIPVAPVLLASEPTPEALSRQMASNHGRALLASAEADALDIVQGRYSGSRNYGILLKGHAGDPVRAPRVGRPGDTIDHPALAVALCVQPQAVRDLWADPHAEGRGLLARFAVVEPPDLIGFREVRPPAVPAAVRARWRAAIERLLAFKPSDTPTTVTLSPDADGIFYDFQKRTESSLGVGDLADRRAWGGKLCGLALRIALTLHALQTWALSGDPVDFPTIDGDTMRSAIAWGDYLASAEHHAKSRLAESEQERETRTLVEWIRRGGKDRDRGTVTANELAHGMRKYRRKPDVAERDLSAMVEAGIGHWDPEAPGPTGGRPTRRFRLVSTVTVTETPKTSGNDGGSGDVPAAGVGSDDPNGEVLL